MAPTRFLPVPAVNLLAAPTLSPGFVSGCVPAADCCTGALQGVLPAAAPSPVLCACCGCNSASAAGAVGPGRTAGAAVLPRLRLTAFGILSCGASNAACCCCFSAAAGSRLWGGGGAMTPCGMRYQQCVNIT